LCGDLQRIVECGSDVASEAEPGGIAGFVGQALAGGDVAFAVLEQVLHRGVACG
jgi:hypothetical protein